MIMKDQGLLFAVHCTKYKEIRNINSINGTKDHRLYLSSIYRLRVIREYRSPRSIRSFNKVFIMLFPIILAPHFIKTGNKDCNPSLHSWHPYYMTVIVTVVFSILQGVQVCIILHSLSSLTIFQITLLPPLVKRSGFFVV